MTGTERITPGQTRVYVVIKEHPMLRPIPTDCRGVSKSYSRRDWAIVCTVINFFTTLLAKPRDIRPRCSLNSYIYRHFSVRYRHSRHAFRPGHEGRSQPWDLHLWTSILLASYVATVLLGGSCSPLGCRSPPLTPHTIPLRPLQTHVTGCQLRRRMGRWPRCADRQFRTTAGWPRYVLRQSQPECRDFD